MAEKEYIPREAALAFQNEVEPLLCRNVVTHDIMSATKDADMVKYLQSIPAADVRHVVRGRWVDYPECLKYTNAYSDDHIVCSACEECFSILDNDCERFNFCPNCGADMREES